MNLKAIALGAALSITTLANASYNGVIYIPTSVEYDIERSLLSNLKHIKTSSRFVSYWNKSSLNSFCSTTERTKNEVSKEVSELSNKFLSESESFRHKGKTEINNAILDISKVVSDGLAPILKACADQKRMKEDQARSLTSYNSVMHKTRSNYFDARNKLNSLIKDYGEVIRAYDMANTHAFNGSYTGHQGLLTGYKDCQVDIAVEGKTLKISFKDENSKYSMTRDLVYMSQDKEDLKNFDFNKEITTNTTCSAKGTNFATLDYKNGSLEDISLTHRKLTAPAQNGIQVMVMCLNEKHEALKNVFAKKYKCFDLVKK